MHCRRGVYVHLAGASLKSMFAVLCSPASPFLYVLEFEAWGGLERKVYKCPNVVITIMAVTVPCVPISIFLTVMEMP